MGTSLFDIGQFIGEKDWLDRLYESNCLFVPRSLLERYGAFDEAFDMPGGGYANLDLFERLEAAADVTTVSVIGEATFHQVHGGITTNVDDPRRPCGSSTITRSTIGSCAADRSTSTAAGSRSRVP